MSRKHGNQFTWMQKRSTCWAQRLADDGWETIQPRLMTVLETYELKQNGWHVEEGDYIQTGLEQLTAA